MIANINYKGKVFGSIPNFPFSFKKPQQYVYKCNRFSILVFKNGTCRIMGCKQKLFENIIEIENDDLSFRVQILQIQSLTIILDLKQNVHLYKLANILKHECVFEPELFPALRCNIFNPICVNIFSSGKIVILGIRTLEFKETVNNIFEYILKHINDSLQ